MKFPFLKKNKPAPTPEAPAAPRTPFPFAAPAQEGEPVPAIHIDAHVLAFLRKYDAAPDQVDLKAAALSGKEVCRVRGDHDYLVRV